MLRSLRRALADRRKRRAAARISPEWAAARANQGAAYLDGADPGWASRIDPGTLVLADGQACVLGQLHGDYRRGLSRSRVLDLSSAPTRFVSPVDLGFQASGEGGEEAERLDYAFLTRAWREAVRQRRNQSLAPVSQGRRGAEVPIGFLVLLVLIGTGCSSNPEAVGPVQDIPASSTVQMPEAVTPEVVVATTSLPSDSLDALDRCRAGLAALALAATPEEEAEAMDSVWSLHYGLATAAETDFDVWPLGFRAFDADGDPIPSGDTDGTAAIDLLACGATTPHRLIDTENLYLLLRE